MPVVVELTVTVKLELDVAVTDPLPPTIKEDGAFSVIVCGAKLIEKLCWT
jgi:hypothetical protein